MQKIEFEHKFIQTKNVRNFDVLMDALALGEGEGRFGMVVGESGRGKSRTTTRYHAYNKTTIYIKTAIIWSETEFLWALAKELEIKPVPKRKGRCFAEIIDCLSKNPRPIFLDELERLPLRFLEIVRDITEITAAPFVIIGEEELLPHMRRSRRVWRRTHQLLEFVPISISEIIVCAAESTKKTNGNGDVIFPGLQLSPGAASIIYHTRTKDISDGNFGIAKRALINLVQIANAQKTTVISEEMAKQAAMAALQPGN